MVQARNDAYLLNSHIDFCKNHFF